MFLDLKESAAIIGLSESGLRKLVKRGAIRYFQPHAHCPIKFRREWIDQYRRRASCETEPQEEPRPTGQVRYPRTLADALEVYTTDAALLVFLDRRYPPDGEPWCHFCGSRRVSVAASGASKCRDCGRKYGLLDDTAFQGVSVSLRAVLIASWCVTVGKDQIRASKLAAAFCISRSAAERLLAISREIKAA